MSHVEELQHFLTLAKHPLTISLLEEGLKRAEEGGVTTNTQNGVPEDSGSTVVSMKPVSTTTVERSSLSLTKITSYGWDQSDRFVKIYITDLKGLSAIKSENAKASFTEKSFTVELFSVGGKNYSLIINDLLNAIDPDKSSIKVKSGMVTISLRKVSSENWACLTGREKKLKDSREMKPSKPDKDEDPGAGLMKMMQKLYDDGDDEMKRTIKKAWHESQEKRAKGEDTI